MRTTIRVECLAQVKVWYSLDGVEKTRLSAGGIERISPISKPSTKYLLRQEVLRASLLAQGPLFTFPPYRQGSVARLAKPTWIVSVRM